jgi:hypothetical protein
MSAGYSSLAKQHTHDWIDTDKVSEENPIVIVKLTEDDGHTDFANAEFAVELRKLSKPGSVCKAQWEDAVTLKLAADQKAAKIKKEKADKDKADTKAVEEAEPPETPVWENSFTEIEEETKNEDIAAALNDGFHDWHAEQKDTTDAGVAKQLRKLDDFMSKQVLENGTKWGVALTASLTEADPEAEKSMLQWWKEAADPRRMAQLHT